LETADSLKKDAEKPDDESEQNEVDVSNRDIDDEGADDASFELVGAHYRGPLPPPAMLSDYNSVLPGLADRIVRMAETEQGQAHRMQRWYAVLRFTGQGAAFFIALAGLVVGGLLINAGHNIEGLVALVGGLGPVVGAFLYRQIRGTSEP
jgi:uncharacterized membrane protein